MNTYPDQPFATKDLAELRIPRHELRAALARGDVRRLMRGVYLRGDLEPTPQMWAGVIGRFLPPGVAIVDWSAAMLHGVDCTDPRDRFSQPLIDVAALVGEPKRRPELRYGQRTIPAAHLSSVAGIPVTSAARTACDLACRLGRGRALGALDGFMRVCSVSRDELLAICDAFKGRRGVVQLRELIYYADPRAESIGESMTRQLILDRSLPEIELQIEIRLPAWGWIRLDLGYLAWKIAVEYDGQDHHSTAEDRAHDALRREALRRAGWHVIVVTKDMLSGDRSEPWLRELRDEIAARRTPRAVRYARGLRYKTGTGRTA